MFRALGGIVNRIVDDLAVDSLPQDSGRTLDQRFDKKGRINFVDVILVQNRVVKAAEAVSDLLRKIGFADVKNPGESEAEERNQDGDSHQQGLGATAGSLSCCFRYIARTKHRI